MERNYENVYLVTSPDEQVQKLLETMSDILVGTLYIAEKGDRIVADFVSEIPDCCWHLESESILMVDEETINIKGEKTRDILSKTTGMSRGTVNKFEKVTNKGSDALKDALLDGKISVSVAEKATELNEEEQKKLVKKAEKLEQEGKKLQVSDVTVQSTQKVNLSEYEWTKDTEDIVAMLQQNDVKLDEQALKKYHFYIKQIKKIVGGRP